MSNGLEGNAVTRNVAQYHIQHVIYAATKFEIATSNGLGGDTFTRKSIFDLDLCATQNVDQYPLHHLTYAATKFEVATANG